MCQGHRARELPQFRTYDAPDAAAGSRTRGAVLAGARSRATIIDTDEQRSLVLVEFRLGGAVAIFGVPMERGRRVSAMAREVDVPPRRLARHFRDQVGLAPKRYSRVRRLQRLLQVLASDRPLPWAQLAVAHGFCDQAHLVNDFRELTGITPTDYRARSAGERHHVPVAAG